MLLDALEADYISTNKYKARSDALKKILMEVGTRVEARRANAAATTLGPACAGNKEKLKIVPAILLSSVFGETEVLDMPALQATPQDSALLATNSWKATKLAQDWLARNISVHVSGWALGGSAIRIVEGSRMHVAPRWGKFGQLEGGWGPALPEASWSAYPLQWGSSCCSSPGCRRFSGPPGRCPEPESRRQNPRFLADVIDGLHKESMKEILVRSGLERCWKNSVALFSPWIDVLVECPLISAATKTHPMTSRLILRVVTLLLTLTTTLAQADTMTFTHEGYGCGMINGTSFGSSVFTIVATGDTANRQSHPAGYYIDHDSASITIEGVGTYEFLIPTRTFVSNSPFEIVGFMRAGASAYDLFVGPSQLGLGSWDMLTSTGPHSGQGQLLQWNWLGPIETSGGGLTFDDDFLICGFSAEVLRTPGAAYCLGDGSGAACPCGANGNAGEGCANTGTGGATLVASGNADFAGDTFQLQVSGIPGAKAGLCVKGSNQLGGGDGNLVGDGLLCTSPQIRSQVIVSDSSGALTMSDWRGQPFGTYSDAANVGTPTYYQWWYRDPANPCSGQGFNFSNGWCVTWTP